MEPDFVQDDFVYWDGYHAYQNGHSTADNPWHPDAEDDKYYSWKKGYDDAAWDD